MSERRFRPKLNKKFFASRDGYDIYSVDAFAIRNHAQPDEEFDNFAIHDEFPDLIPEREVWMSQLAARREAEFFVADALAYFKALEDGASEDDAYDAGLRADRYLREKITGLEYRDGEPHKRIPKKLYVQRYLTLEDEKFPITVWLIDGMLARCYYKTDYTEGGHGIVYPWVPRDEIWIEKDLVPAEAPFIVVHEYIEHRLMRDRDYEYDKAHRICSEIEFDLRQGRTRPDFPGFTRRHPRKSDLHAITRPEFFEYVEREYVKNVFRRARAFASDLVGTILS